MLDNQVTTPGIPPAPASEKAENMIPQSRLNEVLAEKRALAERLAALEAAEKAATEQRLQEQQQWQLLAETRGKELAEATAKAARAADLEAAIAETLDAAISELPETRRHLVPTYGTPEQRLKWIANNRATLAAPEPFSIGAGQRGTSETQTAPQLSAEELATAKRFGMTAEEYAKYKG